MSCIHYKFKSNNEFKTLTFDGVSISVADLRKEIIQKSNMGKIMDDFHLQITNPQTNEEYKDDDLIPKNTSVVLARIPVKRSNKPRMMARAPVAGHLSHKAVRSLS
jgi:E3 ubiquitin-protein ligase RBBP6